MSEDSVEMPSVGIDRIDFPARRGASPGAVLSDRANLRDRFRARPEVDIRATTREIPRVDSFFLSFVANEYEVRVKILIRPPAICIPARRNHTRE